MSPGRACRSGFTLIELLVVIAIIAILAGILFPVFAQAREKARQAACLSHTRQIALGIAMYRQDWDGHGPFAGWPPGPNGEFNLHSPQSHYELEWQFTIQPYLRNVAVLRCPGDRIAFSERPVSYVYNNAMAHNRTPASESEVGDAASVVVLWDGYGPTGSATQLNPPVVIAGVQAANTFREYTNWGYQARWIADPARGLPRHGEGGHVIYMDLHARWRRYGHAATQEQRLATVKVAFPYTTTVNPLTTGRSDWTW
jgi:prepilin-type N-terminal cleavage/methylation domain-containing protein